jgi:hypothetical protein
VKTTRRPSACWPIRPWPRMGSEVSSLVGIASLDTRLRF